MSFRSIVPIDIIVLFFVVFKYIPGVFRTSPQLRLSRDPLPKGK